MKKILVIIGVLGLCLSANAKIQDTYYGITIGKTQSSELLFNSPKSEEDGWTTKISSSREKIVYNGKFLVDDIFMHTLVVKLLNDTVYGLTFYDTSLNIDNAEFYSKWLKKEQDKYAQFTRTDTTEVDKMIPDEEKQYFQKTDGVLQVVAVLSGNGATLSFTIPEMHKRAVKKEVDELLKGFGSYHNPDDIVKGVAGVKFGDNEETVRKVIYRRSSTFLSDEDHCLTYLNTSLGGTTFDYSHFYFRAGKGLVAVSMYQAYPTYKKREAEQVYENITALYKDKYSNMLVVRNDADDKLSVCGEPSDKITDQTTPPIWISLQKSVSKGGDFLYYVKVDYYISNISHLYDDDI